MTNEDTMRCPTLNWTAMSEESCTVRFALAERPGVFAGHFPTQAVLPGVVQVRWVREVLRAWEGRRSSAQGLEPLTLSAITQMKFVKPVMPEDTVELVLTRGKTSPTVIEFHYYALRGGERLLTAQGKVRTHRALVLGDTIVPNQREGAL